MYIIVDCTILMKTSKKIASIGSDFFTQHSVQLVLKLANKNVYEKADTVGNKIYLKMLTQLTCVLPKVMWPFSRVL